MVTRRVIVPSNFVPSVTLGCFYRKDSSVQFSMSPIDKCMTTLRLLIPEADPNGIPLAERAIDELIAAQDGGPRQTHALRLLQERLTPIWESATGKQLNFVNVLFDYMAMSLKALAPPKPRKRVGGYRSK
jgi:hypothetical protein